MKRKTSDPERIHDPERITEIWQDYQRGAEYLNSIGLQKRIEDGWRFFAGDQWDGVEAGGERLPQLNFIKPSVKYAVSVIAQNRMAPSYTPMDGGSFSRDSVISRELNRYAARLWENLKMDARLWEIVQEACIAGDCFAYFYDRDGEIRMEYINGTNIMLGDEQNPDLQEQPYILIVQRRYVEDVKREAAENGISGDMLELAMPDNDTEYEINGTNEVKNGLKCKSVTKLYRKDGFVWMVKSVKNLIYQPDIPIRGVSPDPDAAACGMRLYPVAHYSWNPVPGSARGLGDVWDKIPNQVEVNKALARLFIASKSYCFPHIAYDADKMKEDAVKALSVVGSTVGVRKTNGQPLTDYLTYIQPAAINNIAVAIIQDTIERTRELSGASEMITGTVNPENTSGKAILAAQDSARMPLSMQTTAFRQFAENVALIWYDMFLTYHTEGIMASGTDRSGREFSIRIYPDAIAQAKIGVRIDVSSKDPYHREARESQLISLFASGAITLEELVSVMEDESTFPTAAMKKIVAARKAAKPAASAEALNRLVTEKRQSMSNGAQNMNLPNRQGNLQKVTI